MSEREIRGLLRIICDELDVQAAKVRRVARKVVLPTMLGAGMALSGGCDDGRPVQTDGQVVDGQVVPEAGPVYMAPADMAYLAPDAGPIPPYTAPDAGPIPPYTAPDGGKVDAGPQPPYTAPDAGPIPPYTAPDAGQ